MRGDSCLVMPPFKKGAKNFQFSEQENRDAYQVAAVRIHVERCIQRMKRFAVLDHCQAEMRDYFDDMLIVISGICNLQTDLIAEK